MDHGAASLPLDGSRCARWWSTADRSSTARSVGADLGITRHQLAPRSPNLNAFVERFQGTVLHLHYRTAFRYRFYTSAGDIDADLQAWLRFYNFERPHRGYRTRGGAPAEIFYADCPGLLVEKEWDAEEFTPQSVRS